jgi:hypothetical protein
MRILLFVAVTCFPFAAAAQRGGPPAGQSTIIGRVLHADTNRPVRRATVLLFANLNHPPVRVTPSNQRGEFRFSEVGAGSYFVVAQAPGIVFPKSAFAMTEFGLTTGSVEAEQTQVTVDGKNTARCELRALRASTIKGTVTYADTEPVVNARLVLFRRTGRTITPFFASHITTNDRGMYRIDGLPEGEYFVGVIVGKGISPDSHTRDRMGIPSAFYPGVKTLAEAKAIQVQPATEVTGANMTVSDDDRHRISGVVKWRHNGAGIEGATLLLRRKDDPSVDVSFSNLLRAITPPDLDSDDTLMRDMGLIMMGMPPNLEANEKGEWLFDDLPSGTYLVTAYAPLSKLKNEPKTDADPEAAGAKPDSESSDDAAVSRQVEVTLDEEDRKNVIIELSEGARILGSVTVDDGSQAPVIRLTVTAEGKSDFFLSLRHRSNSDGTFLLRGMPAGDLRLGADFYGSGDLYLKSITFGGQDLSRESLRVNEGAEITGVRITLGKGLATLKGRLQLKNGAPAAGAGIFLVNRDPKLWRSHSARIYANSNATGEFTLKCPPGDYLVFTWPAGGQPLQEVDDFVRSQAATARTISLESKDEKVIELTLPGPPK